MRSKESANVVLMLCLCHMFVFIVPHFLSNFVAQHTHVLYHHLSKSTQTRMYFCRIRCLIIRNIGADILKQPVSSNLRVELHFIYLFIYLRVFSSLISILLPHLFFLYSFHFFSLLTSFLLLLFLSFFISI